MGYNMWAIFALLIIISAEGSRYDRGPQTFYDLSSDIVTAQLNAGGEVIVYLTTDQLRSLEANGAVVQPTEEDEDSPEPPNESQEDDEEKDDTEEQGNTQQEEDEKTSSEDSSEDVRKDIDFEGFLRLLNEEEVDEQTKEEPRNDPQSEEENKEKLRNYSPRITISRQQQRQQEQKNSALTIANKEQVLKIYSSLHYQPNEDAVDATEGFDEKIVAGAPIQGNKKYKLVPYEIEETPEEPSQNLNTRQNVEAAEREVLTKNKLLLERLRKYADDVQNLRNLNRVNGQAKALANSNAKTNAPALERQLNKMLSLYKNNQRKAHVRVTGSRQISQQLKSQKKTAFRKNLKSIAVPVLRADKSDVQKTILVPVETNKFVNIVSRKLSKNSN